MSKSLICLQSVKKQYHDGPRLKEALKGVSLEIQEGEILGLLGVNGAGKTTLSTILAGLHPCSSGDVIYQGKSIYQDIISYRKIVGFCPQKPNLDISLTLEENLIFAGRYHLLSKEAIKRQVEDLMEQFHLQEYAKSKASVLSGGYKQRFLIARTLIHSPKFIILDEPTVGLDPHIRHQLWDYITTFKKRGISVLLTTHYLDEAESLSDRVCIIDDGTVKTIDTPQNLMNLHKQGNLEDVFLKLIQESDYVPPTS
ncbi:MAG: ABC transporter ATP-binding protein [Rhabdochlamydiaceae bacterium]|nr:ABC transporter ATP-binding protein [Rhabdochlamydiaceae bacterium]